MNRVGICFNVEPGRLENQAQTLVKSIRQFGLFNEPIFAFQPRNSGRLSNATLSLFEKHQVIFEKTPINRNYYFNRMANKVLMPAYFENKYGSSFDLIAYFDTDLLITQPLEALFAGEPKVKIAPIHNASYVAISRDNPNHPLWNLILNHLELTTKDLIETTSIYDKKRIYQYYNGGLWIAPTSLKLFAKLKIHFEAILNKKEVLKLKPLHYFFIDQVLFSVLIAKEGLNSKAQVLSKNFNYPLELMQEGAEQASILHYMDYFNEKESDQTPFNQEIKDLISDSRQITYKSRWWLRVREILSYQFYKLSLIAK